MAQKFEFVFKGKCVVFFSKRSAQILQHWKTTCTCNEFLLFLEGQIIISLKMQLKFAAKKYEQIILY